MCWCGIQYLKEDADDCNHQEPPSIAIHFVRTDAPGHVERGDAVQPLRKKDVESNKYLLASLSISYASVPLEMLVISATLRSPEVDPNRILSVSANVRLYPRYGYVVQDMGLYP